MTDENGGFFSKITADPVQVLASGRMVLDGYRCHQAIWALFGDRDDRQRDFLYHRVAGELRSPTFYVVSAREPCETPDFPWVVKPRPYRPMVEPGDQLRFTLRANPVVARARAQGKGHVRHDVVLDAHKRGMPRAEALQEAGVGWLASRAERHGFRLVNAVAEVYEQHRLSRNKGEKPIQFSSVDFRGVLEVTDAGPFRQALFGGIGPAKAFGCGLLLVARM